MTFPQFLQYPSIILNNVIFHEILECLDIGGELNSLVSITKQFEICGVKNLTRTTREDYRLIYKIEFTSDNDKNEKEVI